MCNGSRELLLSGLVAVRRGSLDVPAKTVQVSVPRQRTADAGAGGVDHHGQLPRPGLPCRACEWRHLQDVSVAENVEQLTAARALQSC